MSQIGCTSPCSPTGSQGTRATLAAISPRSLPPQVHLARLLARSDPFDPARRRAEPGRKVPPDSNNYSLGRFARLRRRRYRHRAPSAGRGAGPYRATTPPCPDSDRAPRGPVGRLGRMEDGRPGPCGFGAARGLGQAGRQRSRRLSQYLPLRPLLYLQSVLSSFPLTKTRAPPLPTLLRLAFPGLTLARGPTVGKGARPGSALARHPPVNLAGPAARPATDS